ncbi:MAG: hypothetical protein R3D59_13075 [Paracoccaceae bacterium]
MRVLVTGADRCIGAALVAAAAEAGHPPIAATPPGQGGSVTLDVTDHASQAVLDKAMPALATDLAEKSSAGAPVVPGRARTDRGGADADPDSAEVFAFADRMRRTGPAGVHLARRKARFLSPPS